uniref:Uncharacterized protein n=1 Tax=Anguilla anguilla TaxID=7936 RepID=A0A0E9RL09_ANGAN
MPASGKHSRLTHLSTVILYPALRPPCSAARM